jgi:hypothetical protein
LSINYVKRKKTKIKTNLHWKVVLPICLVFAGELTPLWRHTTSTLLNCIWRNSVVSRHSCLFLVTSSSLLEKLVATICSRRAVDFVLHIYTNLMNNYIIKFDFKKNRQHLLYTGDYPNCSNLQILTRYMPQTNWFYFIYTRKFRLFNFISFSM